MPAHDEQVREFGVFLRNPDGDTRYLTVETYSAGRAADMAEHQLRVEERRDRKHWTAAAVTVSDRLDIAGRCGKCKAVVFERDRPQRIGAEVFCPDCRCFSPEFV